MTKAAEPISTSRAARTPDTLEDEEVDAERQDVPARSDQAAPEDAEPDRVVAPPVISGPECVVIGMSRSFMESSSMKVRSTMLEEDHRAEAPAAE